MNTTELFVEIIIIGIGALGWIFTIILSVFGHEWFPWDSLASFSFLLPIIALTYVLGIIFDRFSDLIFSQWSNKLIKEYFNTKESYFLARTFIYTHASEQIIDLFEYGKSRIRITRAWVLNSLGYIVFPSILIWINKSLIGEYTFPIFAFNTAFWAITFTLALNAWIKLVENDLKRLEGTCLFLSNQKKYISRISFVRER